VTRTLVKGILSPLLSLRFSNISWPLTWVLEYL